LKEKLSQRAGIVGTRIGFLLRTINFTSSIVFRPAVGPIKPPIKISPRLKWLEREADNSVLSIDEVKNAWSQRPFFLHLHVLVINNQKDNLSFTSNIEGECSILEEKQEVICDNSRKIRSGRLGPRGMSEKYSRSYDRLVPK